LLFDFKRDADRHALRREAHPVIASLIIGRRSACCYVGTMRYEILLEPTCTVSALNWTQRAMNLTVEIPDEIAGRLTAGGGVDLSRRALEALALEEYKRGNLTETELQKLLGFGTRYRLDGFLKANGVLIDDFTIEELHSEVNTLQRLGF
jgi:Uncharacterised protein family (UPF0175)